jgi:hypothetical protein
MTTLGRTVLVALMATTLFADYAEDKKKYDACVAKVKKDYPVPPGNVNAQKQMIENECGKPPTPPPAPNRKK